MTEKEVQTIMENKGKKRFTSMLAHAAICVWLTIIALRLDISIITIILFCGLIGYAWEYHLQNFFSKKATPPHSDIWECLAFPIGGVLTIGIWRLLLLF